MMSLLEGVVGGFAGALFTFFGTELQRRFNERDTAVVALGAELTYNLSVVCHVLEKNAPLIQSSGGSHWWELAAFSDASWQAVVISGTLSRLKPGAIGPVARAYAELGKANYSAEKLQSGRVDDMKAKQYTVKVLDAGEEIYNALAALEKRPKYKRLLDKFAQPRDAELCWEDRAQTWREAVGAARS